MWMDSSTKTECEMLEEAVGGAQALAGGEDGESEDGHGRCGKGGGDHVGGKEGGRAGEGGGGGGREEAEGREERE